MDAFHEALARIAFEAGDDLGLVLAGGYAISAHRLTARASRDVDFATAAALPLQQVTERLAEAYRDAGLHVVVIESASRMARLEVSGDGDSSEVDLLKEAIGPPVRMRIGPVLSLDDAVGLKMRALHDRALHRDYIDVHAATTAGGYTRQEAERLGARHTDHFGLDELADRLEAIDLRDERTFTAYGLTAAEIAELRRWAFEWAADLRARTTSGSAPPGGTEDDEWSRYLDE